MKYEELFENNENLKIFLINWGKSENWSGKSVFRMKKHFSREYEIN